MSKKNDNYTMIEIIWIIIKKLVGWGWNLIRWLLFIIVKVLYRILKLHEFERYKDEAFMVKSDGLSHSFNFARSPKFKQLYKEVQEDLVLYKTYVRADIDNDTNESNDILNEILDDVDRLVIEAERESLSRSFRFFNKKRNGLPYVDTDATQMSFYLDNYLNQYGRDDSDDLNTLKE